jgi:glycosyltransferase A (GT-A) superfamily protein (DUF2064 family)
MTVVAVLADPPREGLVLPELAETSPLTEAEAADCYAAMLKDVLVAVERSGGDLLVNYRPDDLLPDDHVTDTAAEAELRALAASALDDVSTARFEPQVGSTFSARAGNTVTHLLREEEATSAAVVRGNAPFLARTIVDSAAMKLRRSSVVLGPSTDGRVYYSAFTAPVDFEDAYDAPAVETLTNRGRDAGHEVDYIPMTPVVERGEDLLTALPFLSARLAAERIVPAYTAEFVNEHGLHVVPGERRVAKAE